MSIPTPLFIKSIFNEDFEQVYEPAEDSFLLLDALEADLETLRKTTHITLECGSGSGIIITALSKSLYNSNSESRKLMIATDINQQACKTTLKCAECNGQRNIIVIRSNLADGLVDSLENQVDLLVFNPPYVPTEELETKTTSNNQINLSWAGGDSGRFITDTFLKHYVPRLLSKPHGRLYLVALDKNNIQELCDILLNDHNITGEIVLERQCGIEKLFILRFNWI